ncbi:MAG: 3-keto-disaccharide hydrolase [Verrucomicrobiales bacterium]
MKNPALLAILAVIASSLFAADDGWTTLFNGKDLNGWTNASGSAPSADWVIEEGALVRKGKGGDIWTKERFGDFILEVEFRATGNSGVFFRTDNPKDCVQTGIEIQVEKPGGPDKHSVGALYDLVAPTKNAARDDWNKMVITARGSKITVELNGEKVNEMDLDRWTTPEQNPDGSKNKFRTALKDFKREGHIGLQDHGHVVAYRNVRVRKV